MFEFFKDNKKIKGNRGEELPSPNEGLPDSYKPYGLCPRCGKQSSFEIQGTLPVTYAPEYIINRDGSEEPSIIDRVTSFCCRNCNQSTIAIEEKWVGELPERQQKTGGRITYRGFYWWPLPESNLSKDIPDEISSVFNEATKSLAAGCPRASVVMSRRALEAICVDKGENTGTLSNRLSNLSSNGILHPTLSEWAKEVRLIGNIGAHYDPIQDVSKEDAQQLLNFIQQLLKFLYEIPSELERIRKKP